MRLNTLRSLARAEGSKVDRCPSRRECIFAVENLHGLRMLIARLTPTFFLVTDAISQWVAVRRDLA